MAIIFVNGCFDILHAGHHAFLEAARNLGGRAEYHRLIVAINSDAYARKLKADKWGPGYPIDDQYTRAAKLRKFADAVTIFDNEDQLLAEISAYMPCILVKGPDYAGKPVTGDTIAPVIILDTPEPESVKEMKRKVYGR